MGEKVPPAPWMPVTKDWQILACGSRYKTVSLSCLHCQLSTDLSLHFWSRLTATKSGQHECHLHQQISWGFQGGQQEPNQPFGCGVWCPQGLFLIPAARGAAVSLATCLHGRATKCSQQSCSAAQELPECSNGSAAAAASQRAPTAMVRWLSWCFPCQQCVWRSLSTCGTTSGTSYCRLCFAAFLFLLQ